MTWLRTIDDAAPRDAEMAIEKAPAQIAGALDFDPSVGAHMTMMKRETITIADVYVPVKRRATLKPDTVQELAQDILANGQKNPILVRRDGDRFVLIEGLHRLEACKALGETTIFGYLVQAAKH